jgi:hypothetical protein
MAYPAPVPSSFNPAVPEARLVQEMSIPIYQARSWLKFLGILSIIGGVLQALTIAGIVVAWLPIWMGVLMYQAGSSIDSAGQFGDKFAFLRSMGNLKTYFVLQGVLTLIGIIFVVSALCISFVLPLLGLTIIPWNQIINSLPTTY